MTSNRKNKNKQKRRKITKWTSIIVLTITAITLFLLSNIFNIKQIKVIGNNKITSEEIISLSGISTNENMFKFFKLKTIKNIKTNPYIEEVAIHRKLNGIVEIKVTERIATYMLETEEEKFAYINNQGYILEVSDEKIERPLLTGYKTESIEAGKRLDIADLKKLNIVIKIINTAEEGKISDKITKIDIENINNILITMEGEGKLIYFGDVKNINDKFVKLRAILEDTADERGEIFLKNINKIYFRKEV